VITFRPHICKNGVFFISYQISVRICEHQQIRTPAHVNLIAKSKNSKGCGDIVALIKNGPLIRFSILVSIFQHNNPVTVFI
jgi:hypothetical protein